MPASWMLMMKGEKKDRLRRALKVLAAPTFEDEVGDVSYLADRVAAERS